MTLSIKCYIYTKVNFLLWNVALECGRPSKLENGKQKYSSRRLGSVVKYNCNEPYTLIGPKKRTCRGIKRWDGNDPSCSKQWSFFVLRSWITLVNIGPLVRLLCYLVIEKKLRKEREKEESKSYEGGFIMPKRWRRGTAFNFLLAI